MVQLLASWSHTLRDELHRRQLQRRLLEVVARLPYEPESRCTYQKLLDEQLRLARAQPAGWRPPSRSDFTDEPVHLP